MATRGRHWRLYCLVADLAAARAVAADLPPAEVGPEDLRVVARRETLIVGLPEAGLRERTAIVDAAKRGLVMGSIGGVISGLVAAVELPVGPVLAGALVVFGGLGGSAFGAWVAAMMGIDEPHRAVRPYEPDIDAGKVLIIIHVDREQLAPIEALIRRRHPGADITAAAQGAIPR